MRRLFLNKRLLSGIAGAIVLLLSAVSVASLHAYYSVPKQPYRASIEYLESRRASGDVVIVIDIAEIGYRFYAERFGLSKELVYVSSLEALDSVLTSRGDGRSFVATTFQRSLRLRHPRLFERIREEWKPARTFPATIGDGAITIWEAAGQATSESASGA